MSAVVVLTPIVIASWPAVSAAAVAAAAALGYAVRPQAAKPPEKIENFAEAEVGESEVVGSELAGSETIQLQRDDVTIEVRQDGQGRCRVCARGRRHSKRELQRMADDVAGRIVQQFIYHKLLTELKSRDGEIVQQERLADDSVRVHIRL